MACVGVVLFLLLHSMAEGRDNGGTLILDPVMWPYPFRATRQDVDGVAPPFSSES